MPDKKKTILNYTTDIEVKRTATDIMGMLVEAGAQGVAIEYQDKEPVALTFRIDVRGQAASYRMPSEWRGVYETLRNNTRIERKLRTEAQAKRVAWRIVKDWVEVQLAIAQAQVASIPQVFLPYMLKPGTNQTLYEAFMSGNLLGPGGEDTVEGEYEEK